MRDQGAAHNQRLLWHLPARDRRLTRWQTRHDSLEPHHRFHSPVSASMFGSRPHFCERRTHMDLRRYYGGYRSVACVDRRIPRGIGRAANGATTRGLLPTPWWAVAILGPVGDGTSKRSLCRAVGSCAQQLERKAQRCGSRRICLHEPATFFCAFQVETGMSPAKAVERLRAETARGALDGNGRSVQEVARSCGFGNAERMRRTFRRVFGAPPSALKYQGR